MAEPQLEAAALVASATMSAVARIIFKRGAAAACGVSEESACALRPLHVAFGAVGRCNLLRPRVKRCGGARAVKPRRRSLLILRSPFLAQVSCRSDARLKAEAHQNVEVVPRTQSRDACRCYAKHHKAPKNNRLAPWTPCCTSPT